MSRGRGGGSIMPILGLIVVALVISIGVSIFGVSMQTVYVESNYTAGNLTTMPYELATGWWTAVAILALVLAIGFSLWYFWG